MTLLQGQGHGASICRPKMTIFDLNCHFSLVVELNVTILGCNVDDMEAHLLSHVWMTSLQGQGHWKGSKSKCIGTSSSTRQYNMGN